MIVDARPWKAEVARLALLLKRRTTQKRWKEATHAKVEQEAFYMAYAIRKLIEANKLSDELESHLVKVYEFPPTGKVVDLLNWHKLHEVYDLSKGRKATLPIEGWCNQIIHSFVFVIACDDLSAGLKGFFVSSDRQKAKGLYFVSVEEVLALANAVWNNDIVCMISRRAGAGKPLEVVMKSSQPCKNDEQ